MEVKIRLLNLMKKGFLQIHYFWKELSLHKTLSNLYLIDFLDMKADY